MRAGRAAAPSKHERLEFRSDRRRRSLAQQALGDVAVIDIGTAQQLDELWIGRPSEVEAGAAR